MPAMACVVTKGAICADAVKTVDTLKPVRRIAAIGEAFAVVHDVAGAALVKLAGPRVTHRDLQCDYHPCTFACLHHRIVIGRKPGELTGKLRDVTKPPKLATQRKAVSCRAGIRLSGGNP